MSVSTRSSPSGVQQLVPPGSEGDLPSGTGREGSRGGRTFGTWQRFGPSGPPEGVTRLTDRRIEWLVRQAQGTARPKETLGQMAARWGVSVRWLRKLLQRWKATGTVPRLNPRRRPHAPPLTDEQQRILREEWAHSPRGATKIYLSLARRGIAIPKMQIYRFGKSQGWVVPNPRKQRPRRYVRYEREHSGSLLHGDFHRTTDQHPHAILWLDDASRMVLAGGEFRSETTAVAISTLKDALRRAAEWGLAVRDVNTDRGTQFYASPWVVGVRERHQFPAFLQSRGIRHIVSRVNHPQTNGKLERLWREYDRHRWRYTTVDEFIDWHNDQVHGSLWVEVFETPREAWQRKMPPDVQLGQFLERVEA
jgi:putative transposase